MNYDDKRAAQRHAMAVRTAEFYSQLAGELMSRGAIVDRGEPKPSGLDHGVVVQQLHTVNGANSQVDVREDRGYSGKHHVVWSVGFAGKPRVHPQRSDGSFNVPDIAAKMLVAIEAYKEAQVKRKVRDDTVRVSKLLADELRRELMEELGSMRPGTIDACYVADKVRLEISVLATPEQAKTIVRAARAAGLVI